MQATVVDLQELLRMRDRLLEENEGMKQKLAKLTEALSERSFENENLSGSQKSTSLLGKKLFQEASIVSEEPFFD